MIKHITHTLMIVCLTMASTIVGSEGSADANGRKRKLAMPIQVAAANSVSVNGNKRVHLLSSAQSNLTDNDALEMLVRGMLVMRGFKEHIERQKNSAVTLKPYRLANVSSLSSQPSNVVGALPARVVDFGLLSAGVQSLDAHTVPATCLSLLRLAETENRESIPMPTSPHEWVKWTKPMLRHGSPKRLQAAILEGLDLVPNGKEFLRTIASNYFTNVPYGFRIWNWDSGKKCAVPNERTYGALRELANQQDQSLAERHALIRLKVLKPYVFAELALRSYYSERVKSI